MTSTSMLENTVLHVLLVTFLSKLFIYRLLTEGMRLGTADILLHFFKDTKFK